MQKPRKRILRKSVIEVSVNILIAFEDTIRLSVHILIASADTLIVFLNRIRKIEYEGGSLFSVSCFFCCHIVTLSHFEHNRLIMYLLQA